ncbi:MAG: RsmD family RNA methyltransferase [Solirubrobacterales bacterium]|nr:RsmD family RNA methyltransferase [Solirubrobacterales bacterium]
MTVTAERQAAAPDVESFGPLKILFDYRVLRPRRWTIVQAWWAARLAEELPGGSVLELCAGAGHIGLMAALLADRDLVQVDSDRTACRYARANAIAAGIGHRVDVRCAPLHRALVAGEKFPLIVADPPYLRSVDLARYPDDPRHAVDGGRDGLRVVRQCLDVVGAHLAGGGMCLLQTRGPRQLSVIGPLLAARSLALDDAQIVDDERAVGLIRSGGADRSQHNELSSDQAGSAC